MLSIFVITLLLGILVGFLAGMLGIGGGLVVVPALVMLLPAFGVVPPEQAILVAIATSLATVIITATSSVYAHHRLENVPWKTAGAVMTGAAVGAWVVGYMAHNISANVLQLIFGCAVLLLALRMLGSRSAVGKRALPSKLPIMLISSVLGGVASLLGIGGGALFVPMLNYFSLDMRRAIGVAAASGIAIAMFGSLGYVIAGWQHYQLSDGFVGYIYVPAALGVVTSSVFTAPLGAKLVQHLPVLTIKRIFGIFMLLVAAKMILS